MIFRLSQNLNAKIKVGTLETLPLHENPLADWSAQLFVADRLQYILFSNTKSLCSTVFPGRGVPNGSDFIEAALSAIREVLKDDGKRSLSKRFITPGRESIQFAKPLNRTVTGSMNEMKKEARYWLRADRLSDLEISRLLNESLLSILAPSKSARYGRPRDAFQKLCNNEG